SSEVMFCLDLLHSAMAEPDKRSIFDSATARTLWRSLERAEASLGGPVGKPTLYANVVSGLRRSLAGDIAGLRERHGITFAPSRSLPQANDLPSEHFLASIEEIVPVERDRSFALLALILSRSL